MFPSGTAITLLSSQVTGQDGYGNDLWSESRRTIPNCVVWDRYSTENNQGGDTVVVGISVWLPAGESIAATDAVIVSGLRYVVDGEPGVYSSPLTGTTPGVLVALRRATG